MYRPLNMLDTVGKLFEKLIKRRLTDAAHVAGDFLAKQCGSIAGQPSIDVLEVVWKFSKRRGWIRHIVATTPNVKTSPILRGGVTCLRWWKIVRILQTTFCGY